VQTSAGADRTAPRASRAGRSAGPRPPQLSGGLPLIGHTVEFVRSTIDLLFRAQRELGEVAGLRVANKNMVALFGPEAHEAVFRAPDSQLNAAEAYKIMTPVFGENMVYDASPERMDEQLKMLLPALKDRRMRTYTEIIVEEVEASIADWGEEGEIDLVDYCRVLTNFTSAHCLLGREFRHDMTHEFAEVYHDLERGITPLAYINAHLPLPAFRARDRARRKLVGMIGAIIEARRRSGRMGEDFLQTLIESRYASGAALTDDEITGMLLAAMFAGHHTSSVTTAWTLLELMQHPTCRRTVVAQIDELYERSGLTSFDSLQEFTEGDCAVMEALRLHPPLFLLIRVALQEFEFKGYRFPKGTWLLLSPTVSQRIREVFEDADCFDPQRFSADRLKTLHPFAYIAFGGGRHKCLGNAFARLQIKAILATLLRRFEFSSTRDRIGSDFHGLVIGPSQPCRVRYRRRPAWPARRAPMRDEMAARALAATSTPAIGAKPFRVICDLDLCQSHAACMGEAPEVFRVGRAGKVSLIQELPSPELRSKVEAAVKHCPTGTLRIEELAFEGEASAEAMDGGSDPPTHPARWTADPDAGA
jgi:sterol 14-demethylase